MKQLGVLYNPVAGQGRAVEVARTLHAVLESSGYSVTELQTSPPGLPKEWADALYDLDLLIVIGGDGTVRHAAGPAAEAGCPIYQVPSGTENLFAREFGMNTRPETLLQAIRQGEIRDVDLGVVNGDRFLLMTSVGFDAEVIHSLAESRTGPITHLNYLFPIMRQMMQWTPPELTILVDGQSVVDTERGMVIVANSRQYARGLDPAVHALMDDGLLDVVFYPLRSVFGLPGWLIRTKERRHVDDPRLVYVTGREIHIEAKPAARCQIDGDAGLADFDGSDHPSGEAHLRTPLEIGLRPERVSVLLPPFPL